MISWFFGFTNMGSVNEFLYQKLVCFGGFFWVSVSTLFLALLPFVGRFFYRVLGDESSRENKSNCLAVALHEGNNDDSAPVKQEAEFEKRKADCIEFKDTDNGEKDSPKFLKFKFQTFEEFSRSNKGNWDVLPSTSTSKYEFKSERYISGFVEEPEDVSFNVKELYADSKNVSTSNQEIIVSSEKYFIQQNSEGETVRAEETEDSGDNACRKELLAKTEVTALIEESKPALDVDNNKPSDQDGSGDAHFLSVKDLIASDSDSDSIASSNEHSAMSQFIGSTSDGFLSDKDFEEEFEFNIMRDIIGEKVELADEYLDLEMLDLQNFSNGADDFDDEDSDIMDELEKLEESEVKNSSTQDSEMLSENDFQDNKDLKNREVGGKDNGVKSSSKESNKSSLQNSSSASLDSEDSNGLETLWEHQDLIEQVKMELKKVRAIGLPTILEESEYPKITDDLKPWKIDEKFQHEDTMDELHKFYKSYRERMRKFDILNYQKMYAIGFLQSSKGPLKSISSPNYSSNPGLASLLSQNFLIGSKLKKSESDPMKKFIRELHSDLEVVYVGQLCLSWEILHWQYEKSLELWESDPYGLRRYNEVAGELQQFQVLMQRFIENEPFEGPRVQNYIKNRCVLRNLLQVPVIREDSRKDKKRAKTRRDDYAITSDMLVETMEESIRIFWRFVRADKDANIPIQRCRKKAQVEPQDSVDLELLAEVRSSLQKKERRLKDILRSGNCILRKFQKQQDNSDQVLYFFSQVDMKLVARVLNMSKITTDQLLWCRNKLSKINFVSRKKIHVEPSFFLFPC